MFFFKDFRGSVGCRVEGTPSRIRLKASWGVPGLDKKRPKQLEEG